MFTKKTDDTKTTLNDVIDDLYRNMIALTPDQEEYQVMMKQLVKLHKLKNASSKRVSPDTLAIVAGNLLGIGMIVAHERVGIVTSKALNFVMKASH